MSGSALIHAEVVRLHDGPEYYRRAVCMRALLIVEVGVPG